MLVRLDTDDGHAPEEAKKAGQKPILSSGRPKGFASGTAPATMKSDAIAIERDDGRYYLDVVEARQRRSIAQRRMLR